MPVTSTLANSQLPVLMIVAAGPLQLPAFEEARRQGCRIIAADGSASAPGMRLADRAYQIDINQSEAIVSIGRTEKVSGVTSICTEFGVRTVAAVAQALGLPGLRPEAARRATDKRLMRRAFLISGVPSPEFAEVSDIESAIRAAERFGYPVALKIPRSAGSRGVYRVATPVELVERYRQARALEVSGDLLVEQWLTGPEVSVEGCCVGTEPHIVQITDKLLFTGPNPVEAGHTQPSRLPAEVQDEIRRTSAAGIRALGLEDCGFHAELKVTTSGPCVIEIGARLGGDRISSHLTPLSTGVDLVRAVIDIALGRRPDLEIRFNRGSAIRYFHATPGAVITEIGGLDEVRAMPGLELLFPESERDGPLRPGFKIPEIRSSLDRYGHVIFSGLTREKAAARAEAASRAILCSSTLQDPNPLALPSPEESTAKETPL